MAHLLQFHKSLKLVHPLLQSSFLLLLLLFRHGDFHCSASQHVDSFLCSVAELQTAFPSGYLIFHFQHFPSVSCTLVEIFHCFAWSMFIMFMPDYHHCRFNIFLGNSRVSPLIAGLYCLFSRTPVGLFLCVVSFG